MLTRYTVDGFDECGNYAGGGTVPPFSIFDIDQQDHLRARFARRWQAALVCWLLNRFDEPLQPEASGSCPRRAPPKPFDWPSTKKKILARLVEIDDEIENYLRNLRR